LNSNNNNGKFRWSNVLLISFAHLSHDIFSSFFQPMSSLIQVKFGISNSAIGILSIIQRIPSFLNPLVGILADKMPARYFVIFTPAITTIAMSLLGVAPHFIVVAVLLFIMGISAAFFHVPAPVMIRKVSGKQTGKGMSFYMLGGETARTIAPVIVAGAISLWGLEGTYKLMPFGIIASVIVYFRLKKIKISEDIVKEKKQSTFYSTFKKYLPFFVVLAGIIFFRSVIKSSLLTYLVIYFDIDKNETLWYANTAFALFQLGGMAGVLSFGMISDRIGRKLCLLIISVITPTLMWIFTIPGAHLFLPLLFVIGFFSIGATPVILAMVTEIRSEHPSFINSIYMTLSFGLGALISWLAGVVSDNIGLDETYRLTAYIALGGIPLVFLLPGKFIVSNKL